MTSDWDDYTLHIKLLKHYQSIIGVLIVHVNTEVGCGLPYLRTGVVHDKTNRETCQSDIQSYGLPSGYTPLQHLIQNTGIPWIMYETGYLSVWCKFCRWSTYTETPNQQGHLIFYDSGPTIWKSNRQYTIVLSTTEDELDNFVNCVRSVLHTMRILDSMGSP